MTYTLDNFVADTNAALADAPGPEGREKVRLGLERLLAEPSFIGQVEALAIPDGMHVLYKDERFGYLILAHASREDSHHAPHNHGRSWAIYGQISHYTDMAEWKRAGGEGGALAVSRSYRLLPGQAGTYADGAIHSVSNPAGTRIIRITGTDLNQIDREGFDPDTGAVRNLRKAAR